MLTKAENIGLFVLSWIIGMILMYFYFDYPGVFETEMLLFLVPITGFLCGILVRIVIGLAILIIYMFDSIVSLALFAMRLRKYPNDWIDEDVLDNWLFQDVINSFMESL